jgi:hypothetical protein
LFEITPMCTSNWDIYRNEMYLISQRINRLFCISIEILLVSTMGFSFSITDIVLDRNIDLGEVTLVESNDYSMLAVHNSLYI